LIEEIDELLENVEQDLEGNFDNEEESDEE
jgi:hypothetical protein